MFPLIFVVSVCRNFGVCALFLGIYPELKHFLCPKLGEDQKKGLHPEMERFLCPKLREDQNKGLQLELERILGSKSLLSVLLL